MEKGASLIGIHAVATRQHTILWEPDSHRWSSGDHRMSDWWQRWWICCWQHQFGTLPLCGSLSPGQRISAVVSPAVVLEDTAPVIRRPMGAKRPKGGRDPPSVLDLMASSPKVTPLFRNAGVKSHALKSRFLGKRRSSGQNITPAFSEGSL